MDGMFRMPEKEKKGQKGRGISRQNRVNQLQESIEGVNW